MTNRLCSSISVLFLIVLLVLLVAQAAHAQQAGSVWDEARRAGREAGSFAAADEDYCHDMDSGIAFTPDEVKGRNAWLLWTGGNDRLWDKLSVSSFGAFDLLKTISSHPKFKFSRVQEADVARRADRTVNPRHGETNGHTSTTSRHFLRELEEERSSRPRERDRHNSLGPCHDSLPLRVLLLQEPCG
jgi:hypothetical protein